VACWLLPAARCLHLQPFLVDLSSGGMSALCMTCTCSHLATGRLCCLDVLSAGQISCWCGSNGERTRLCRPSVFWNQVQLQPWILTLGMMLSMKLRLRLRMEGHRQHSLSGQRLC
jgi:hypothetical protein